MLLLQICCAGSEWRWIAMVERRVLSKVDVLWIPNFSIRRLACADLKKHANGLSVFVLEELVGI